MYVGGANRIGCSLHETIKQNSTFCAMAFRREVSSPRLPHKGPSLETSNSVSVSEKSISLGFSKT